jgi:flagellar protein FlaJ
MRAKLERFLENYIYLSGIKKTPKAYVDEFLRNLFILSMATVILLGSGILLLLELLPISVAPEQAYLFLLLSPLPLVAAIFLLLEPYLQARKHMSGAEREMLYVMSLLTTYAANGVSPHVALERLKDYQELFPETTKIIKRIEKIKMLYVVDDLEAMEFEGRKVTSSLISDLLLSSASIERRGGDIYSVLRDKMKSIFNAVRESYKTLADKMQLIGDVILIVYGVLPLTLYTMFAMYASEDSAFQSMLYSYIVNPLMGIVLILLVDTLYPRTPVKYTKYYKMALYMTPLGVITFTVIYLPWLLGYIKPKPEVLSGLPWTSVALAMALIAVSVPIALRYIAETRKLTSIDYALPSFVRDIAEEIKKGNTPDLAILTLSKTRSYGGELDKIIKKMNSVIEAGRTFIEAGKSVMQDLSWYGKMSFALMLEATVMGAKPEVFDEVAEVTREIIDSVKIAKSSVTPLRIFGMVTAALIVGITAMLIRYVLEPIASMAESFQTAMASASTFIGIIGIRFITPPMLPSLVDSIMTGSILTLFMMGMLTGKMSDGTLAAGFQYAIIMLAIGIIMILALFLI